MMEGNVQQQRQHSAIRMDITLKLMQRYHKPFIRETGTQIKYDLEQFRQEPEKLAKWYKQREREQEETPEQYEIQ